MKNYQNKKIKILKALSVFAFVFISTFAFSHRASAATISGTLYGTNESTVISTTPNVKISVNGGAATTVAANGSGVFSFGSVTASVGDIITIWISGATEKGTLVFRYGSSCTGYTDCTGLSVYRDEVILDSKDGTALSNTNLSGCDNDTGTGCNTTDIGFTSNSGTLTLATGRTLRMKDSTALFTPAGNVSADVYNQTAGTYTNTTATVTIGGNMTVGSGATFTTTSGAITITGDLVVDGTMTGNGALTVNGGDVTGNGTIIFTSPDDNGGYLKNIKQVTNYYSTTYVVTNTGSIYHWGSNLLTPAKVLKGAATVTDTDGTYLNNISSVEHTDDTACAVSNAGNVYCWGVGSGGSLGDNDTSYHTVAQPSRVLKGEAVGADNDGTYLNNIAKIALTSTANCAVSNAGNVYCWGGAYPGVLGNGQDVTDAGVPVRVLSGDQAAVADTDGTYLNNINFISGNYQDRFCVLSVGGNPYCWGGGYFGDENELSYVASSTPVRPHKGAAAVADNDGTYLTNIAYISAGYQHNCAVSVGGNTYCWGYQGNGRLGDGQTVTEPTSPVRVLKGADGTTNASDTDGTNLINMSKISAGSNYTCALSNGGRPYCWGRQSGGRLGNAVTTSNKTTPTRVLQGVDGNIDIYDTDGVYLINMATISASLQDGTTCAASITVGNLYCWGTNNSGSLGNGLSTGSKSTPVRVLTGAANSMPTTTALRINGTGNFGGNGNWSLVNLTFGGATSGTGSGNISANVITILNTKSLSAGSLTYTITGEGTPFDIAGTFTANSSTVKYQGASGVYVSPATYNNLSLLGSTINTSSQTAAYFYFGTTSGQDINVVDLNIGDSTYYTNINGATFAPYLNITGNLTIGSKTAYTPTPTLFFKKSGTQTLTNNSTTGTSIGAISVGYSNQYSYLRNITVDSSIVSSSGTSADFTDFPVLINGTYSYLKATSTGGKVWNMNGYDVVFATDASCTNKLSWETEKYSSTTGEVVYWVKFPVLKYLYNTTIYMCYGNSSITTDQSNRTDTWNSNFKAVYHLADGTTLSATDSTSNANNGTKQGTPSATSGKLGGAANFSGSGDDISISSISLNLPNNGYYTISTWINTPLNANGSGWNTLTRGVNNDHQIIVRQSDSHLGSYLNNSGGFLDSGFDMSTLSSGWHHLSSLTLGGGFTWYYIDGVNVGYITNGSVSEISYIGNYQGGGQQWGKLDEFRVLTLTDSTNEEARIKVDYLSQSATSTFYSIGSEKTTTASTGSTLNFGSSATTTSVNICSANTLSLNGSNTLAITDVGTPFIINGVFTPSTGTVVYTGAGGTNIATSTYYNLMIKPGSNSAIHTLMGGTFTIDGSLTVGDGRYSSSTVTANTNTSILDIAGDFINNLTNFYANASSTFTVGGSWYNHGAFSHNSGTVTMDGSSSSKTFDARDGAFNNLVFNSSGSVWNSISDVITTNLTMTAGTLTGTKNIYASGNITGSGTINYSSDTQDSVYLSNISDISVGDNSTCVVSVNGKIYCWGRDISGLLGDGIDDQINYYPNAQQVLKGEATGADTDGTYLINIKQVSVSEQTVCAVANSGNTYCWGFDMGNGVANLTPVKVLKGLAAGADNDGTYLTNIKQVSAGYYNNCAVSNAGNTYCWGDDSRGYGALGNGESAVTYSAPVQVLKGTAAGADNDGTYLTNIKQVSVGSKFPQTPYVCAVANSGNIYCWGDNVGTGNNQVSGFTSTPVRPIGWGGVNANVADTDGTNLINISNISSGNLAACATSNSGNVYCWGENSPGNLGINIFGAGFAYPRHVLKGGDTASTDTDGTYLTNIYQTYTSGISSGSCSVSIGGNVYCWGNGNMGEMGNNDTSTYGIPVRVHKSMNGLTNYADASGIYLVNMIKVDRACSISNGNRLYCWSNVANDGTYELTPTRITKGAQSLSDSGYENNAINMSGIANLGGSTDWTFGNITFNGTTTATGNFTSNGDITINQYKKLDGSSKTITIGGNWINNGTYASSTSSVIISPVGTTSTITGTVGTDFYNLSAVGSGGGKNIRFGEGVNVGVYHSLQLNGVSGSPLYLNSTSTTNQWTIFLGSLASMSNSYIYVKNSACAGGSNSIAAGQNSNNDGNNGNCWVFSVQGGGSGTAPSLGGESGGGSPVGGGGDGGGAPTGGSDGGGSVLLTDLTEGGAVTYTGIDCNGGEGGSNVYDNTSVSKWCTSSVPSAGVPVSTMYDFSGATSYSVNKYTITSANDSPARDPKDWTLQGCQGTCAVGSDTGWVTIDTQTNQFTGASRFETKTYEFTNPTAYQQYRMRFTENNADASYFQLSELQLFTVSQGGGSPSP